MGKAYIVVFKKSSHLNFSIFHPHQADFFQPLQHTPVYLQLFQLPKGQRPKFQSPLELVVRRGEMVIADDVSVVAGETERKFFFRAALRQELDGLEVDGQLLQVGICRRQLLQDLTAWPLPSLYLELSYPLIASLLRSIRQAGSVLHVTDDAHWISSTNLLQNLYNFIWQPFHIIHNDVWVFCLLPKAFKGCFQCLYRR